MKKAATEKTIRLKLDWLAFTFKPDREAIKKEYNKGNPKGFEHIHDVLVDEKSDLDLFFEFFPEFQEVSKDFLILSSYSHYENVMGYLGVSDTCRISFNSSEDYTSVEMGVNVSVPSHGLEWLFGLFGLDIEDDLAVHNLFTILKERYCHASRIDLAFDDYGKTFRPAKYIEWWFAGKFRTHFKKFQLASSSRTVGNTFYLGSRTSGKMLRIYDKDFESDGAIDAVRYEFELHVKYARDMFEYLVENKVVGFIEFLRSYFDIIDPIYDAHNRNKCPLLPEWASWLDNLDFSEELPEKVEIPQYTLSQRKSEVTSWLYNSCLRTIKGYVEVFGWQNLQEHVRKDNRAIPDKYRVLLDEVRKDQEWNNDAVHYKYSFDYEGAGTKEYMPEIHGNASQDWLGRRVC